MCRLLDGHKLIMYPYNPINLSTADRRQSSFILLYLLTKTFKIVLFMYQFWENVTYYYLLYCSDGPNVQR